MENQLDKTKQSQSSQNISEEASLNEELIVNEEPKQEDPLLNYKSFFMIKNFDDTDIISCASLSENHVVVGTNSGKVYQINAKTGQVMNTFQIHQKKITGVYIKDSSAIITVSYDGLLKITSLCPEFDNMTLEIKELELSCFCLRAQSFNASNIEFFIGTPLGKLFYFYNGWLQNTKEILHLNEEEGPVLNVVCYHEIVAWATPKNIRVIHFSKKQKICIIERPKISPHFPQYLYESKAAKPTLLWKPEQNSTDLLYVAWLKLRQEDQKFQMEVTKSIDLEHIFISGLSLIKEFMVISQFTHAKKTDEEISSNVTTLKDKQYERIPELAIYKSQTEVLMKDQLNSFEPIFQEIHYNLITSPKFDGNSFIYNPDVIMKIAPITILDRIEYLLFKKKFDDIFNLIEQAKEQIPQEEITKVQNLYLEYLLKNKDVDRLKIYIPKFVDINKERWEHWISRLMQKKVLSQLLDIIPRDYPRLDLKIYTKIFEHLIDIKDHKKFQHGLKSFPGYLINQDHLIEVVKKQIENDNELANNKDVLEVLFLLHDLNRDYQTAFHIIVKMKDIRLFEFLRRVQLDFDLSKYLGKLLIIGSAQTIDYIFQRYGRMQQLKIVDQCVHMLQKSDRNDKDKLLYLFLDEVFNKSKEQSKDFHQLQVELYCKYNPQKLMQFLQKSDYYSPEEAVKTCQNFQLYKEQAYLLLKLGNEDEAIRVLINKCKKVNEIIEIAVKFNINVDHLWELILQRAMHNTDQIKTLLHYVDQYNKPALILEALGPEVTLKEVKDSLMIAFRKMKLFKFVLKAALHVCEKAKNDQILETVWFNSKGHHDIDNLCDECQQPLLTNNILDSYITQMQQTQSLHSNEGLQFNQKPILSQHLSCGHKFHKKCVQLKRQENEENKSNKNKNKLELSQQPFKRDRNNSSRQSAVVSRNSFSSGSSKTKVSTISLNKAFECNICNKYNIFE